MRSLLVLACLGLLVAPAFGDTIVNGDFEATPVTTGWTAYETGNPVLTHAGLSATGLAAGTQAAYFTDDQNGGIYQSVTGLQSEWEMSFLFATDAPTNVSGTDGRTLHFIVNNDSTGVDNGDIGILMRIDINGNLQAYGGGWQPLDTQTVIDFSVDANGNDSFADAGDTLNVYSLKIVGDYTTSPSYDVYLSSANSETLTLLADDVSYFFNTPGVGVAPQSVRFCQDSNNGRNGNYVVDQISFGAEVPEPGTALMLLAGLVSLALIRRRA